MKSTGQILELEKSLKKLENLHASFDYLRISLASPERIQSWAERVLPTGEILGEVKRPETINFRTHQPEPDGLFCEKIFGPIKNWKCKCGKYNGFIVNKICEDCLVEITEARVRRYRMGYIHLTCPVAHLWYSKGVPNYLCTLLRIFECTKGTAQARKEKEFKVSQLENILYFKEGERGLSEMNALYQFSFEKPSNEVEKFFFQMTPQKRRMGAEIVKAALEAIDIKTQIQKDRSILTQLTSCLLQGVILEKTIIRRIRILESFLLTQTKPSWMVLTTLPVLPPTLRPLLELESGRLVAADVNEIYRLILTRNVRLSDFLSSYPAPTVVVFGARKLIQESVDSLIDNARVPKEKSVTLNNKALKSLTEILEGKQGRFRQTLLGKRVDYSGRSVIVVGPQLRLNQCGLPYEMAAELFQPFLINELLKTKIKAPSHNTKLAHIIIKKRKPFIWNLIIALTKKYAILLNRAPTLHRFGIQAFDPVLVLGQAIHLHPLVCTGFNADFDGDQMAVHLPLYEVSQLEIRSMMRPCFNVLSPSNGEVILKPSQDMVIGCYYLTFMVYQFKYPTQKWFSTPTQALNAFYQKKLTLHSPLLVRYSSCQFEIFLENQALQLREKTNKNLGKKPVHFFKRSFEIWKQIEVTKTKSYFFTSFGILIAYRQHETFYQVTDLFLETTPGRLIFSLNLQTTLSTS